MGDPRRGPLTGDGDVARGEGRVDVAAVAGVEAGDDVASGIHHPFLGRAVGVQQRSPRPSGLFGVEDGGQYVVLDADRAAAGIRRLRRLADDRGDPLADVADDVVEHPRVVGVVGAVLVPARGVSDVGDVEVGEDRHDTGCCESRIRVDRGDPRVRVG